MPNVGKSTLFNALTAAGVSAENYPFCTIEPNVGVVAVPDPRLDALAAIVKPQKILATTVEFVDIAGLVAGASKGEGLGNKFLSHIRETHAIAHVVRCFENPDVTHVTGAIDPERDIGIINTELLLADLESVDRALDKATKQAKAAKKEDMLWRDFLARLQAHLNQGAPARSFALPAEYRAPFQAMTLITAKPVMYVTNVDEAGLGGNAFVERVRALAAAEHSQVVIVCAALEAEIAGLEPADRDVFLKEMGLAEPGLSRVIRTGYELLGLRTFFTAGPKEVRAWTTRRGATAPQAAGEIHTDFERGFIRAEVIAYEEYIRGDGEQGAREAGRLRLEGKEYVVQEGDVMHFRFNV